MTFSEIIAQFGLVGVLAILISLAWRSMSRVAEEFSALWVNDSAAKQLSFFQLVLAVVTKSSFVQQSKKLRSYGVSSGVWVVILVSIVLQGKELNQLTITVLDSTPIGGKVAFSEQEIDDLLEKRDKLLPNKELQ